MQHSIPDITLTQAQSILRVSKNTIWRWVHSGALKTSMVGGRYRTTEQWIEQLVKPVVIEVKQVSDTTTKGRSDVAGGEEAVRIFQQECGIRKKVSRSRLHK